ncbi:MAG: hypothetical protein ACRD4L_00560 [Pyrinomonadaceae bacterium]
MQDAQSIYVQTVAQLSSAEQLRLAALILEDLARKSQSDSSILQTSDDKLSVLEVLEGLSDEQIFKTPAEVDDYLKMERASWER